MNGQASGGSDLGFVFEIGQRPAEQGGTDLGDGVRLGPVHRVDETPAVIFHSHRIYRGDADIGGVDYLSCVICRTVLLGEIGLVETEQGRGLGSRVLARLRHGLPGYRWFITPQKSTSARFWTRVRATYPNEYFAEDRRCPHNPY